MQSDASQSLARKTNQDILNLLYRQTSKVAIYHLLASLILVFCFSSIAETIDLIIWFGLISVVSIFRIILFQLYNQNNNPDNYSLWMQSWTGMAAIMGTIYALGLVYFTPLAEKEYVFSLGLYVVTVSTLIVSSYGISIYASLSFFLPLVLIPSYFLLSQGGREGIISTVAIGFYAIVLLSIVNRVSEVFKRSIKLAYQHQFEKDKRILLEKQLQDISRRDGLTGLFNRRYFDEVLEVEIGRAHRNHSSLCLVMFDIDCFTEYNDHYGHVAGDSCIIKVAEITEALANRKGDLIARYGGQEFAIILPNIDLTGAVAFAKKLQETIQLKRIEHETSQLTNLKSVTVSVGVTSLLPFSKITPLELIQEADSALYEAKRKGRNRVHCNDNNGLGQSLSR